MSHSNPTASSSNHFQLVINNALKAYEKRTKNDLLSHPLATQLQDCNSPADILAVLYQQVQGPSQSRSSEDRWTKWLDPTVNILYTLSETFGEGVSLVSQMRTCQTTHSHIYMAGILTWKGYIRRCWCPSLSTYPP